MLIHISSFVLSAFLCFQNQKMMATLHCRPLECMCPVKDLVTTRLPVALPGGLVTRNCGIVAARIYGYFYTRVQDSSDKCHKVNLMKNEKTLVTRLVMRNLFSSSLFLFEEYIHLSDGLQKNLQMKSGKALKTKPLPLSSQLLKFTMQQPGMANYI